MKPLPTFAQLLTRFPALRELGATTRLRPIPYVQQLTATECGAACLAMVLRYFGRTVPVEQLRDACVSGRDSTNAQALIDTGRLHGLRGMAVALDLDQLQYLERGAILHWAFSHFVVFDGVGRGGVNVVDPRRGRWFVPHADFARDFTGVAIIFEPAADFTAASGSQRPVRGYLRQILSERGFVPHILVTSALLQVLGLAIPLLTRIFIDRVIPQRDYQLLTVLAVGIALTLVFQSWTTMIRAYLLLYLRTRLDSRMTIGFLDHLSQLSFGFFQRRSTGDLLVRINSNTTVREILTGTVLSTALDGVLAVSYLGLLLFVSPPIAVLTLGLALVQAVVFFLTRRMQRQYIAQALDAQAKSHGYLIELLSSIESLKALGAEGRAVERWSALFATELNVSLRRGRLEAVIEAITVIVRGASSLALLGVGALQVMRGTLTLGDMMALIAIAAGFMTPLLGLVAAATRLQLLVIYLERLNDVLHAPTERDRPGSVRPGALTGAVTVDDVSFRYGPISPLVLRRISLEIRAGEFVAIVGRSGSGKSTLARLLVALYAPTEGTIRYDGIDLRDMDISIARRQLGVVTQQTQLFAGSVRANISLAQPDLPLDRVVEAARLAHIHDDIVAMPLQYDTPLIDRGASLSGGQQQRIALARALVRQPQMLVLDEATSQLDAATERAVQDELARLHCTRIVIAHRLSTIERADRILVLDQGRLVEEGVHEQLVMAGGAYGGLVAAQMGGRGATSDPARV